MIQKYEKVEELLGSPESLKDLSKEEIVQLYQLRDNLQKNLSEILPALQERTKTQMDSHLEGIEEPEIKEYVA
jgi:K+/H+ antiporter YhaU regulatory subunit KhtT